MPSQDHFWSLAARSYEKDFIDPYRQDVANPLLKFLERLVNPKKTAADLGCGIGPLLPHLAPRFAQVHAVDFAAGMLERAKQKAAKFTNIQFHHASFLNLEPLYHKVDIALAVNSLVLPEV